MILSLSAALDLASEAISAARWEIRRADTLSLSVAVDVRDQAARARSTAYVFMAAGLERCTKDCLRRVLGEINSRGVLLKDLRPNLFALQCSGDIDFLRSSGRAKTLARADRAA